MIKVYYYPNCNTCKKALKWLEEQGIQVTKLHIVSNTPSPEEIEEIHKLSALPIKRFFNTSGKVYRELNLKDKAGEMSQNEIYQLLSENGMLLKRPILVSEDKALVGFKITEWESLV